MVISAFCTYKICDTIRQPVRFAIVLVSMTKGTVHCRTWSLNVSWNLLATITTVTATAADAYEFQWGKNLKPKQLPEYILPLHWIETAAYCFHWIECCNVQAQLNFEWEKTRFHWNWNIWKENPCSHFNKTKLGLRHFKMSKWKQKLISIGCLCFDCIAHNVWIWIWI